MTKVLQVMAGAAHGGAELFFTRLVVALAEAGLDQHVVMAPDPDRAARLRAVGIDPVETSFSPLNYFAARGALKRELKTFAPDVALTWMNRASSIMPRGAPVHAARLGGYYKLKYYTKCDHMIGNTRGIAAWLQREGWPAERVHYLPNFVESTRLPAIDRASLNTPASAKVIVALGRLHQDKAFDVLIKALPALPDCIAWIAGDSEHDDTHEKYLRQLAADLGVAAQIRWLGWRRDVPALCAAGDLLCCPSRIEPLGNVVLEGWAQGLPVVAAASAGPAELIVDRQNGRLVPMEDHAALAAAVRSVIDDPGLCAAVIAGGSRTLADNYSKAAVVKAYLDFFERVKGTGRCAA